MAQKLNQERLRKIARVLKSQGIGAPIDTRKAIQPGMIRGGKSLREWSDKLDPVLSGKAEIFRQSKTSEKGYRKTYERAHVTDARTGKVDDILIVPHSADERAALTPDGKIVISHPAGMERVQIPVEYHKLEQWLKDARHQKYLKEGYQGFGFRLFGNSSIYFRNIGQLWSKFIAYESVQDAIHGSKNEQREMYRNFELLRVTSHEKWEKQRQQNIATNKAARKPKKKGRKKK